MNWDNIIDNVIAAGLVGACAIGIRALTNYTRKNSYQVITRLFTIIAILIALTPVYFIVYIYLNSPFDKAYILKLLIWSFLFMLEIFFAMFIHLSNMNTRIGKFGSSLMKKEVARWILPGNYRYVALAYLNSGTIHEYDVRSAFKPDYAMGKIKRPDMIDVLNKLQEEGWIVFREEGEKLMARITFEGREYFKRLEKEINEEKIRLEKEIESIDHRYE